MPTSNVVLILLPLKLFEMAKQVIKTAVELDASLCLIFLFFLGFCLCIHQPSKMIDFIGFRLNLRLSSLQTSP